MALCDNIITTIESSECLTDSLAKINSNFTNLQTTYEVLYDRINKLVQVRTFFYYGPNAFFDASSGMANNEAAIPSPETITAFVNSPTQLNLPSISYLNDVAYVVYQKTGFQYSLSATNPSISANYVWDTVDANSQQQLIYSFAPTLIIWRLAYDGAVYRISTGFPKYHREMTNNTFAQWNTPQTWSTF